MDIIKSLSEIEDLIEYARKMMDWGEYTGDHEGFWEARKAMRDAFDKITEAKKAINHIPIVQERV